jgi:tetratricopeptide (TPR) repeat protein
MNARHRRNDTNDRFRTVQCVGRVIDKGLSILFVAGAVAFLPLPAAAQRDVSAEAERYARCMVDAHKNPAAGADSASAWRAAGGGHPAEHCNAVALIGLGRYEEAGKRLDALADAMMKGPADLRAQVLDQAGQAWLLAGKPARAETDLTQALALSPDDADLLIDRAEAFAGEKRYAEAVADLDRALTLDPRRADALVFRAAAHRRLDQLPAALKDVETVLRLTPNQPDALLERGNIRILQNDEAGARADWRQVAAVAPHSPAEKMATENLAKLDAAHKAAPEKAAPHKR